MIVVYAFFHKKIPHTYSVEKIDELIKTAPFIMVKDKCCDLNLIDFGYVIASYNGIPVCL